MCARSGRRRDPRARCNRPGVTRSLQRRCGPCFGRALDSELYLPSRLRFQGILRCTLCALRSFLYSSLYAPRAACQRTSRNGASYPLGRRQRTVCRAIWISSFPTAYPSGLRNWSARRQTAIQFCAMRTSSPARNSTDVGSEASRPTARLLGEESQLSTLADLTTNERTCESSLQRPARGQSRLHITKFPCVGADGGPPIKVGRASQCFYTARAASCEPGRTQSYVPSSEQRARIASVQPEWQWGLLQLRAAERHEALCNLCASSPPMR
jgi:hypothetical protein